MENIGRDVYDRLIEWMNTGWFKLPPSPHRRPMLESFFTPGEAEAVIGLPFGYSTLEELAELKGMPARELKPLLGRLADLGMVYESIRGESVRYRLADPLFIFMRGYFWAAPTDARATQTAPHINRYYYDNLFDQAEVPTKKGLRAIPVNQTIEDTRQVMDFENIAKVVERFEYHTVSHCPCKHRHNTDPEMPGCEYPTEVCLHFDDLGRYIVAHGLGREITKEETLRILKKAADAGLVHGISNWEHKPDTICSCCACCCMWLQNYHGLGHARSMDASNFVVSVNPETCKACGLCLRRCPMDALRFATTHQATNKHKKAPVLIDAELCLGCGVCAHACPSGSLTLTPRARSTRPPARDKDWVISWFQDHKKAREEGTTP